MKCDSCGENLRPSARFCSGCGVQIHVEEREQTASEVSESAEPNLSAAESAPERLEVALASAKKNPAKVFGIVGALIAALLLASALSGGGAGTTSTVQKPVTLQKFVCVPGSTAGSAQLGNPSNSDVEAFVTVGLFTDSGTLLFEGTARGRVPANGTRRLEVQLDRTMGTGGATKCRVIDFGS